MEGRSSRSRTTKQNKIVWRDQGSSEALSTSSTTIDEGEPVGSKRSKITKDNMRFPDTPELLDERVGYANPFIVRIPRTAITLNLNSYNSHNGGSAKKDTAQSRPSTEIRLADSSVPDLAPTGNEENVVRVEKCTVTKKPKIIEDVTCLEGTILCRTSLKKFADEPAKATRRKRTSEVDEKSARSRGEDDPPRKSRIREKFRRLFGNDVTLSESDEEKRITAKLTSRKRRNESRMSSDSGVCLNEHTSDIICSEALEKQRDNEVPGEFPREKLRKNTKPDIGEYTKENLGEYPRKITNEELREYTKENLGEHPRQNTKEEFREYAEKNLGKYPKENLRKNNKEELREHTKENLRKNTKEELREHTKENFRKYPRENFRKNLEEYTGKNPKANPKEYAEKNPKANPKEYAEKNPKANPKEYAEQNPRENSTRKPSEFPSEDPKEFPSEDPNEFSSEDPNEFSSEDPREISSIKIEDTEVESAQVFSMPLLDSVCEQRAEKARSEALPDSSTSQLDKMSPQPDSSSGGKLTILVTPLNIQDSDTFDPLRLELDLSQEAQISTPTSTTSGSPIVETIKLENNFEDRQNLIGTCVDDSCQIDDRISVKENLSPEAETESCDGDRLIIAEDLEPEADQTRECEASEESVQSIIEIPILPQWRSDSMSGPEKNASNETDVNLSSDSNETADKNLPIEKVARPETALKVREKIPNDLTPVIEASSAAHQKVPIISVRIVDFDAGMLDGLGEAIGVSNETSPVTVDLNSVNNLDQLNLENYVSLTQPSNDETIVSNNPSAKLSEVTIDDSLTDGRKSLNLDLGFDLNGRTLQGLEDRTKIRRSLNHEVPVSEIPKGVFDAQKTQDVPKAPNFRVLHPSELGSRWCPTPLTAEVPQSHPRFPPKPAIAQPRFAASPAMAQVRFSANPAIAQPPLHPPLPRYPNSQILRNQSYPPLRQSAPEVLIQTPPPSPLEQMQSLVSQTSSSAHGIEDLSYKKSSGYVNMALGPRPAHNGNGLSLSWTMDKHQNWTTTTSSQNAESHLEKQHSLMSRIFDCLISMASIIERISRESDMAKIIQFNKDYVTKKELLFFELSRFACTQGITDLRMIVAKIMNYYDYLVPPERRTLNIEGVQYMLQLEQVATLNTLYRTRLGEPPPLPPYRPNRPSVMQSSLFTESQRQLLYNQVSTYYCLYNVLQYQLVAQEEAAKAKRTRRRYPKAPAGQNQAVQAPAAGRRERLNLSTARKVQRLAPAPVDQPRTLQQTMECTVERIVRKDGVGNCTVTDKRHEEIVELALRDANMDRTVAVIVDELFRQHPTERIPEGQAVEGNSPGQISEMNLQGQNMAGNIQGQCVDVNVQEQSTDINAQGQRIDINVRGQRTDINTQGQRIDTNIQGRSIEENVQFQAIERNAQDKSIESSAPCRTTEKNLQGQIIERSVQAQARYTNSRGQTIERNVEGQDIEKSCQGQVIKINVEGQDIEKNRQGQDIEKNRQGHILERPVQGQAIDINIRGQCTEKIVQGQNIEMTVQGQDIEKIRQGHIIESSVEGQSVNINIQGQCIEKSLQSQTILDVEAQRNEANVPGQAVKKSVQFDPIEVNAPAEVIENNVQGQAIVEKGSPVESVLTRSTSSVEDGNTSVLDVLKEFDVLDSITNGPASRRSNLSKAMKSPEDKLPDSIAKERGSKAADPTCPEDSPSPTTTSAETGGKTDNHQNLDPAISADVGAGSSRIVPVITIDDDEDWDLASANSVETVRDAEDATIADEISILDVKSISKDVFNNMGVKVDDAVTTPVAKTDDERMVYDETEGDCIDIKTELSDCFQCGKRSEVVCEQCRLAAYCSPKCHQDHWLAIHHLTCKPAPQEIIETTV